MSPTARSLIVAVLTTLALARPPPAEAAAFLPLGDLPGGTTGSYAYGISGDGSVVVGNSYSSAASNGNSEAFRWTESSGMVGLGFLPTNLLTSGASAISADGSVIVGYGWGSQSNVEAVRWSGSGGPQAMGNLGPPDLASSAYAVSDDGSVVTGTSFNQGGAFRWTNGGGMVSVGPLPAGYRLSDAATISPDGRLIGGSLQRPVDVLDTDAAIWDESGNVTVIPKPVGATSLMTRSLSDDGTIALLDLQFTGLYGTYSCPALWSATSPNVQCLPNLGNAVIITGLDMTGDGQVIVGEALTLGRARTDAFIWTAAGGLQLLQDILLQQGATGLEGWTLYNASAISGDGRWIVGSGKDPLGNEIAFRAEIAPVPLPPALSLVLPAIAAIAIRARRRRNPGDTSLV